MDWYKVASAPTLQGLQAAVPAKYQQIPVGKRVRIVINTSPFPVAPLFDLAGAEFAAKLLDVGGKLIDVSGNGAFEAIIEVEAVDTASVSMESQDGAQMGIGWVAIAGIIAVVAALLPLITKLATLLANFVPGGSSPGGGVMDYFKTLFGDYTPYVLIGGAVILLLLLKGKSSQGAAPVIYNLPSGSRRSRDDDD